MKLLKKIGAMYPKSYTIKSNKDLRKKIFKWTPSNIKWFLKAEQTTDFYEKAIEAMGPCIENSKTAVDIGCGIGTFSIALAEKGLKVTSIDMSSIVTDVLRERIKGNSIYNIDVFNTAFEFMTDRESYDIVLISYMMGLVNNSSIKKILKLSNRYVVLILPVDSIKNDFSIMELYKRMGLNVEKLKQQTYKELLETFDKLKIKYNLKLFESEFGQPFASREEAVNFIQYYFKIPTGRKIHLIKWIEEKLIERNGEYYLPNKKSSAMIIIEK